MSDYEEPKDDNQPRPDDQHIPDDNNKPAVIPDSNVVPYEDLPFIGKVEDFFLNLGGTITDLFGTIA